MSELNAVPSSYEAAVNYVTKPQAAFCRPASSPPRGPDFICIGAQKSSTSWLYSNLGCHPLIWMPPLKELDYFSSLYLRNWHLDHARWRGPVAKARQWWLDNTLCSVVERERALEVLSYLDTESPNDDWYRGVFRFAAPDQVAGEVTPHYCLLPRDAIRHVLTVNPNVKIIALLRDPAERAFSQACMLAGHNPSLAAVWEVVRGDKFTELYCFSDYPRWLSAWRGLVPAGNLLIDYFRRVECEPQAVIERLCGFLGVTYHADLFQAANAPVFSGTRPHEDFTEVLNHLRDKFARIYDELERFMPEVARDLCLVRRQTLQGDGRSGDLPPPELGRGR